MKQISFKLQPILLKEHRPIEIRAEQDHSIVQAIQAILGILEHILDDDDAQPSWADSWTRCPRQPFDVSGQ